MTVVRRYSLHVFRKSDGFPLPSALWFVISLLLLEAFVFAQFVKRHELSAAPFRDLYYYEFFSIMNLS